MKQITTSEVLNPSISRTRAPPHSGWNVSGSTALGFRRILLLGIPRRNRSSRSGSETTTTNEALERETSSQRRSQGRNLDGSQNFAVQSSEPLYSRTKGARSHFDSNAPTKTKRP